MGVDANLYLPADIDPRFVSEVAGILMGARKVRTGFGVDVNPTKNTPSTEFELRECGVKSMPQMCYIGAYSFHWCSRPHHADGPKKKFKDKVVNCMLARSNATTIALFRGLAKTFGGIVVTNDCDDDEFEEYSRPKATKDEQGLQPEDDPYWQPFQDHLFAVEPITAEDLIEANEDSAYNWEEWDKGVEEFAEWHRWAYDLLKSYKQKGDRFATSLM